MPTTFGKIIRRDAPTDASRARYPGLFAGMKIRKKLIVLHTSFTLVLVLILVAGLRPAVREVLETAELDETSLVLRAMLPSLPGIDSAPPPRGERPDGRDQPLRGTAEDLKLDSRSAAQARLSPGEPIETETPALGRCCVAFVPGPRLPSGGEFVALRVHIPEARSALWRLYVFTSLALLGVYVLVALTLEILILPRHVYDPIRRMLHADEAVQDGRAADETIPDDVIPADELGAIMRSRNESIRSLRRSQAALADALDRLERVALDLTKKNHLLEAARRNLADSERLASLGMMSAGIAHELNTPLSVLKGLVEKLNADPHAGVDPPTAALMLRVVRRLERLSEGLLDYARVRPPRTVPAPMAALVAEAATLVGLDRDATDVAIHNHVPTDLIVECDADRVVQVLVNLIRNAAEAARAGAGDGGRVTVEADRLEKNGEDWVSLRVADNGRGIDPDVLPRLFEPFASTRLDSRGTGLGLAVAEGIIREHGGVILARSRASMSADAHPHDATDTHAPLLSGAVFEILVPRVAAPRAADPPPPLPVTSRRGTVHA